MSVGSAGPFQKFRVGEPDRGGMKIAFIIGRTTQVMVYMIEGNHLKIDAIFDQPTERQRQILAVFNRLYPSISLTLQKEKGLALKHDLGGALYLALADDKETCDVDAYFKDVREQISTRALDAARLIYVLTGLVSALLVSIVLSLLYISSLGQRAGVSSLLLGAIGGAIGSALSVFARSNTLEISPFKQHVFTAFQGGARIALGALFGFVFVCCVRANILLGVLADKTLGLFAFSILAGSSETFVPELLKRMETEASAARKVKVGRRSLFRGRGANKDT